MTYNTLRRTELITCIIMPFILAAAIIWGLWYLPLIAIVAAAVTFGVIVYRIKEAYTDERLKAIDEKAGKAAMNITSFTLMIAGSVLLAVNSDISTSVGQAAITIYAMAVGMSVINYFTKMYFRVKLGEK